MDRRYFLCHFLGLSLLLAGCSKAPETSQTTPNSAEELARVPASAPSDANDPRPVIVAFGDSLSAGYGVDPGLSYPDYLQKELDRLNYKYRVVNAGISGDTTSGGVARLDSVLSHDPEIVILELGGNDGLRGLPVSVTRANLEKMIKTLQNSGAKVLLAGITLPPNYGDDYIREFERNYKDLAKTHNVPLIPFLLEDVALSPGLMQRDGIHPTSEGNRKVAALVMRHLQPLLVKPIKG